ncbi:hypothetical protein ACS0TY_034941 [Phlomoides rotata]
MATTDGAVTPPPVTAEEAVVPSPLESEDLTSIANQSSNTPPTTHPPPPPQSQIPETLPPSPRHFFNSMAEVKDVLDAISAFQQCYDTLRTHLDSVKAAILAKLPSEAPQIAQPMASPNPDVPNDESELQKQPEEEQIAPEPEFVDLCKTMCSRGVRKYLATHLSNTPMLREQVPKALAEAPNPPKLVLECLGKFFLQGSKAFSRNSPMIPAREASILILECFLLMIGMDTSIQDSSGALNIQKDVKAEADSAAIAWRKRLISEGGVAKASQIDARGLLLFVACFGIPVLFKVEDIRDIVIAANAKEIVTVLHKSHVLMSKISDTVEGMMKKKMEVDAVDIVYTFGLEQRFNPQSILVSFLRESKETWKKSRKGSHGSSATLMQHEANKKQLAALKSISKCLGKHKIDPAKLLPGWQINDKIATLQKDIFNSDKKTPSQKRKPNETETSQKAKGPEAKRPRYRNQHKGTGASSHIDNRRNLMLDNYSAPQAVVYGGPGAGLLPPQNIIPQHGGPTILSTYSGAPHDAASRQAINPYIWHRDSPAVDERYYNYTNSISASHSQPPPAGVGLSSFYRPATTSVEGFAGNITNNASSLGVGVSRGGASGGATTSDPYHFVDSVTESEWYPTTVAATVVLPASHHSSSYLYQV